MSWRLIVRSALAQSIVLLLPFLAAGTVSWLRGGCWFAFQLVGLAVGILLTSAKNPGLLKARMEHAQPQEPFDRVFSHLYLWSSAALLTVAGLGVRWNWSQLSWRWFFVGLGLGVAGQIPILAASTTNPYLEGFVRIQSERGHYVVTSGVYSVIRHPMYTGLMLVILSWPLLLGSAWALIPAGLAALAYPFRVLNEERVLRERLPGYKAYMERTPIRLIPGLW